MEDQLSLAIRNALDALGAGEVPFVVEWPADLAHGDFATNAALAASKALGRNPREIAEDIANALREELGEQVSRVEVAGPGFVNITLARATIANTIQSVSEADWGVGAARTGERVVFEYSCPNPFKEMHIGHLVPTVIGEAVSRTIENQGARVLRDTYGGDVGPHVAKALWGLARKGITIPSTLEEVNAAYVHGARAYEESESAKAEIDTLNVSLYIALAKEDDERTEEERALLETWRHGREVSLQGDRVIWKLLGTEFDYELHESETTPIGVRVVNEALEKGVFKESEGAVIYDGEKKGLHTLVFLTSRGTPTYEAKDIGLAFLKEERMAPIDASYIASSLEQKGHFQVLLAALADIAPEIAEKTKYVPHGFMRLTTGKMSSRTGTVITAASLIEDVVARAGERNKDPLVAEAVAIGAIKYMILRQAAGGDIIFDPEQSLSLDGDSGPYLQYALVRARSIIAQEGITEVGAMPETPHDIERLIMRFPEVARRAEAELAPHKITQYLTQLAGEWNSFYAAHRIAGSEYEGYYRALARAFATTMARGLHILGIPAPEKM